MVYQIVEDMLNEGSKTGEPFAYLEKLLLNVVQKYVQDKDERKKILLEAEKYEKQVAEHITTLGHLFRKFENEIEVDVAEEIDLPSKEED